MTQPWYPASWLDADGKPLPEVHEVAKGQWPPCKPNDVVEVLARNDRQKMRPSPEKACAAGRKSWWGRRGCHIVAIYILERAA